MPTQDFDRPPRPRLTLRVGISGKRAIPPDKEKDVRAALSDAFEAIGLFLVGCQAKHEGVWSSDPPLLRIISGMAEGADQIAAEIAVARAHRKIPHDDKVETRLAAILPFPRDDFTKDFRQDPNDHDGSKTRNAEEFAKTTLHFEELLREATKEAVLEIDDEASYQDRNFGYAALRDTLLEHSDVLIAVSDDKDGGTGGTVDVIRIAMREGIPVIKIAVESGEFCLMQPADPDAVVQAPKEDEAFEPRKQLPEKLARILRLIVEPPIAPRQETHDGPRSGRKRLEQYLHEEFKPVWFGRIFKAFRDALIAWPRRARARRCRLAMKAFIGSLKSYRIETPGEKISELWPAERGEVPFVVDSNNKEFFRIHVIRHAWADTLSVRYADATRSSYIAIAFLGAMAVLVGLVALFPQDEAHSLIAKVVALFCEATILWLVGVLFFGPAHHGLWHERMVEYRALAELLRHQRFVYALGASDRLERTADRTWREPDAWVGWYVRATMRELGFPSAVLSSDYRHRLMEAFQREELEGQREYNKRVAARFITIDERLSFIVQRLWRGTIYLAIFGAVLLVALFQIEHHKLWGHEYAAQALHIAKPGLTLLMAFIPACIAAIHGIRFQMEFQNTAERAATTERELGQLAESLGRLGAAPGRRYSLFYIRAANEAMSADLAGWSNVYRGKSPEPP